MATLKALLDALVAAGADVKGDAGTRALYHCAAYDSAAKEEVFLHLLELGADPARPLEGFDGPLAYYAAYAGWPRALARLLPDGGVDLRVSQFTLLGRLVENMRQWRDEDARFEGRAACVAFLLRRGADLRAALLRSSHDGGCTVADFIHANPPLLAHLRAQGIEVAATPRPLREEQLVQDLVALPFHAHLPAESVLPVREALVRLLTPTETAGCPPFDIAHRALSLLHEAEPACAVQAVMQLGLWQKPAADWTEAETAFFSALNLSPSVVLPADFVLSQAVALEARGA